MSEATDRYSRARKPEHSTIGDAIERFDRDADAFTAGAQYVLDRMTAIIDRILMDPHTSEYLTNRAADILANVHEAIL